MKFTRLLATCLLGASLMFTASHAQAHGSGSHIMGTVTAASDTQLDVLTKSGTRLVIKLTDKTTFQARKGTTGLRPKVGDRVVIDAANKDNFLTATQVQFATPPAKGKAAN